MLGWVFCGMGDHEMFTQRCFPLCFSFYLCPCSSGPATQIDASLRRYVMACKAPSDKGYFSRSHSLSFSFPKHQRMREREIICWVWSLSCNECMWDHRRRAEAETNSTFCIRPMAQQLIVHKHQHHHRHRHRHRLHYDDELGWLQIAIISHDTTLAASVSNRRHEVSAQK